MFDPKKRKVITAIIAVILVLAMVVPTVLSLIPSTFQFFKREMISAFLDTERIMVKYPFFCSSFSIAPIMVLT